MNRHPHAKKEKENSPETIQLTRSEMGDLFGMSDSTIKRQKFLTPKKINARVIRYSLQDVHRMVEQGYVLLPDRAQAFQITLPGAVASPEPVAKVGKEDVEIKLLIELMRHHLAKEPTSRATLLQFIGELLSVGS